MRFFRHQLNHPLWTWCEFGWAEIIRMIHSISFCVQFRREKAVILEQGWKWRLPYHPATNAWCLTYSCEQRRGKLAAVFKKYAVSRDFQMEACLRSWLILRAHVSLWPPYSRASTLLLMACPNLSLLHRSAFQAYSFCFVLRIGPNSSRATYLVTRRWTANQYKRRWGLDCCDGDDGADEEGI